MVVDDDGGGGDVCANSGRWTKSSTSARSRQLQS